MLSISKFHTEEAANVFFALIIGAAYSGIIGSILDDMRFQEDMLNKNIFNY
jgi:hypothetical protein